MKNTLLPTVCDMSKESNRENMENPQPEESPLEPPQMNPENTANNVENTCEESHCMTHKTDEVKPSSEQNTGVAIKNVESESLNSLLVYDSDSGSEFNSSSSEMMKLNLKWQVRNGSEETSSLSASSSDEGDSDSSTEYEDETFAKEVSVEQNKGAVKKTNTSNLDKDMLLDQLPPVPDLSALNIHVDDENFMHMGNVLGIVDKLVTVAAVPNIPAYDLDTLLFLDNGKRPLGFVFDVLGQVTSPIYAIRFNSADDIKNLQIQIGTKVYSAPSSKHTQYVFLQQLLKMKGSDASWLDDNEVPEEFADYSDDENECYRRHGNRKLQTQVKRTHSSENYKQFENTMNRRNILNTRLNKYMDSYKQAKINKAKARRSQASQDTISAVMPPGFDPTVPPPSLTRHFAFYHPSETAGQHSMPPEYSMGGQNNNSSQSFAPHFFMNNFVANLSQTNSANYFTNHGGDNHPGPSHE